MRQVAALLGILFASLSGYAAYLLASSGIALVAKDMVDRGLLFFGGVLIGLFAIILVGQSLRLLVARR